MGGQAAARNERCEKRGSPQGSAKVIHAQTVGTQERGETDGEDHAAAVAPGGEGAANERQRAGEVPALGSAYRGRLPCRAPTTSNTIPPARTIPLRTGGIGTVFCSSLVAWIGPASKTRSCFV